MTITDTIDQVVNLTKNEKLLVEKYFTVKSLPKGELWIKEGQYCNHIALLIKVFCGYSIMTKMEMKPVVSLCLRRTSFLLIPVF